MLLRITKDMKARISLMDLTTIHVILNIEGDNIKKTNQHVAMWDLSDVGSEVNLWTILEFKLQFIHSELTLESCRDPYLLGLS